MIPLSRLIRSLLIALPLGFGVWGLAQSPFGPPLIRASDAEIRRQIDAAFARHMSPERLEQEIAQSPPERALWLADLARDEGMTLSPQTLARLENLPTSWGQGVVDCAACAWDTAACTSLNHLAICALPLELTPLGDLNALRRQGMLYLSGEGVDGLEVSLALIGLAATGAVVVSAGTSGAVKAGSSVVRLANRLGHLSPPLREVFDPPIHWRALMGRAPLDQITDGAKLARLTDVTQDLGRIATSTSLPQTVALLRHIETPAEAKAIARLSEVTGARTLSRVEVLGKARVMRMMLRVSDLALSTLTALYAGLVQLLVMAAGAIARRLWR